MSLWICPICGKQNSMKHYDPTDFVNDILIILLRGLGKGKGFEEVDRYSLLDGSDPELLKLISDRVAVIYDMLYEDVEDDEEDEDVQDDDEEEDSEPLSELEKEIRRDEEEDNYEADEEPPVLEDDNEEEDKSDSDEELIE